VKGILVVAHGSRAKETESTLDAILSMVRTKQPEVIIEHAFMEFSERTVEKGVATLVTKGVTEIKIVPYFLFMGIHMKEDIPRMVSECVANFPNLKISMGESLGTDERLADILVDRMKN
jgi:sirohydrochlorin ferrochelatase